MLEFQRFFSDLVRAGGTGGLNWHWHAAQSLKRWQGTLAHIEYFLNTTQPASDELLLIGASAGWMMPRSWLLRFARIDVFDIDPIAAPLFQWRHGRHLKQQGTAVHHHRMDALENLSQLLQQHPQACLWFDNVLGQHRYRLRDLERTEKELNALKHQLAQRSWGSLHDWLSGPMKTSQTALPRVFLGEAGDALKSEFTQELLQNIGAHDIWSDHLTGQVFAPHTPTHYIPWAFRPQYGHWLQAGWMNP
jgi:hypothetical protein